MKLTRYDLYIDNIFIRSFYNYSELIQFLSRYIKNCPFCNIEVQKYG